MNKKQQEESLLAAVVEYFNQYGTDAFEMDGDMLTEDGVIELANLSERYREAGDTELDQMDAFAVVSKAFRVHLGIE